MDPIRKKVVVVGRRYTSLLQTSRKMLIGPLFKELESEVSLRQRDSHSVEWKFLSTKRTILSVENVVTSRMMAS